MSVSVLARLNRMGSIGKGRNDQERAGKDRNEEKERRVVEKAEREGIQDFAYPPYAVSMTMINYSFIVFYIYLLIY